MVTTFPTKPQWLRKPVRSGAGKQGVTSLLREKGLATVCENARCPNLSECFEKGTATFMILGSVCTRACAFCAVTKGAPLPVDPSEPGRVAQAAEAMGLKHVVITSVTRDDLDDQGAGHFAETVRAVKAALPGSTVEVLTPDFQGNREMLETVLNASPGVFNHNLETVPRLYAVRPGASFARSLTLLACAKELRPGLTTKTGVLLGLGETAREVADLLTAAASARIDILTLGQYLPPSRLHHPVAEYVTPGAFEEYRRAGLAAGIPRVLSGPFVRSSYMAEHMAHSFNPTHTRSPL